MYFMKSPERLNKKPIGDFLKSVGAKRTFFFLDEAVVQIEVLEDLLKGRPEWKVANLSFSNGRRTRFALHTAPLHGLDDHRARLYATREIEFQPPAQMNSPNAGGPLPSMPKHSSAKGELRPVRKENSIRRAGFCPTAEWASSPLDNSGPTAYDSPRVTRRGRKWAKI